MTKTVALVGCGNIGSRTLQSLVSIPSEQTGGLTIWCVDPESAALDLARARADEVLDGPLAGGATVHYRTRIGDLPDCIDLAIVSTTSAPRFDVTRELLNHARVDRLVLEKFLFTRKPHYADMTERLRATGTRAWVNCPRPAWPGYIDLSQRLNGFGPVAIRVAGANWAMASNAIHFIAGFSSLGGERFDQFDGSRLDSKPLENKRGGYLEVTGTLLAHGDRGSIAELVSLPHGRASLTVDIIGEAGRFIVFEGQNRMLYQTEQTDWAWTETQFPMLHASQMAPTFLALLTEGDCRLPTYEDMVAPHLNLISVYNRVFFGEGSEDTPCPVT